MASFTVAGKNRILDQLLRFQELTTMQAYLRLAYTGGRRFMTSLGTYWANPSGGAIIWTFPSALPWTDALTPSEPLTTVEWRVTSTSEGSSVSALDALVLGTDISMVDVGLSPAQPKVTKYSFGFPTLNGEWKLGMNARNFVAECLARPRHQDRSLRVTSAVTSLDVYEGTPPTDPDAAPGTKLWNYTESAGTPFYLAASFGSASLSASRLSPALATGTGTYGRLTIAGNTGFSAVIQGSVGAAGSGGRLHLRLDFIRAGRGPFPEPIINDLAQSGAFAAPAQRPEGH